MAKRKSKNQSDDFTSDLIRSLNKDHGARDGSSLIEWVFVIFYLLMR